MSITKLDVGDYVSVVLCSAILQFSPTKDPAKVYDKNLRLNKTL